MARLEGGFWDLNKDLVKDLADTIFFLECLHGGLGKQVCIEREGKMGKMLRFCAAKSV